MSYKKIYSFFIDNSFCMYLSNIVLQIKRLKISLPCRFVLSNVLGMSKHRSPDFQKQIARAKSIGCRVIQRNNKYLILSPDTKTQYTGHEAAHAVIKIKKFVDKVEDWLDKDGKILKLI